MAFTLVEEIASRVERKPHELLKPVSMMHWEQKGTLLRILFQAIKLL